MHIAHSLADGENYFTTRPSIGPVPFKHDLKRATLLVQKFSALQQKLVSRSRCHPPSPSKVAWDANIITADLWSTFVNNTAFRNSRTLLGGFKRDDPSDLVNIQSVYQDNVTLARMAESQRSLEWLRDFGTCADHIIGRKSTLPQAGMGAFATRNLSQGTIVAQLPMIHIPDRDRLSMRSLRLDDKGESWEPINETVVGYQLLLNYCYGHAASTMLLCPYGPMTNYINHNQSTANVMMRWGNATKGNHMPHLLNQTIEEIASSGATTKLAMELVALRDIGADEEIFLDYGDEWEAAWARHLSSWNPVPNANHYISAMQLETDKTRRLRSVFEEIRERTYSDDVITLCDTACQKNPLEMNMQHKNGTLALYLWETKAEWWPCSIFRYRDDQENHGEYLYTVHLFKEEKGVPQNNFVLRDLPREVFHFADKPGKSDAHLHNAFRHDVRISDSLFPEIWRNV